MLHQFENRERAPFQSPALHGGWLAVQLGARILATNHPSNSDYIAITVEMSRYGGRMVGRSTTSLCNNLLTSLEGNEENR